MLDSLIPLVTIFYVLFVNALGWQIFGDPDAADIVFTSGANILAVGINVTHQVVMTGNALVYPVTRQVKVLDNVKPTFIWSVLINQ